MDIQTDGRIDLWTEGRMDRQTDRSTDAQTDGHRQTGLAYQVSSPETKNSQDISCNKKAMERYQK